MLVFSDAPIIVEKKSLKEQNDFILATKEPKTPLVSSPSSPQVVQETVNSSQIKEPDLTNQAAIDFSSISSNLVKKENNFATVLKFSLITVGVYLIYSKLLK